MPRFAPRVLTGVGLLLLAVSAGCLPKAEQLRPAAIWDRMRGAGPGGFVVRSALIERPAGDAYLNRGLWAEAGRPLAPELTALLGQNGLRVGVFTGVLPGEFDRLVQTGHSTIDAMDRSFAPGRAKVLPVNGPSDRAAFRLLTDLAASPVPCDFVAVECGFSVTASKFDGDRVKLVLEPQLQHGDKQLYLKASADETGFTRQDRKPLEAYAALTFEVTVGPKDYLIVGPTADPADTLGSAFFFHATPDRVRQQLLVIRAVASPDEPAAQK